MTNLAEVVETGVSIMIIITVVVLIRLHVNRELYGSHVPFWKTLWSAIFHPEKQKEARRSLKLLILFHVLFIAGLALISFLIATTSK